MNTTTREESAAVNNAGLSLLRQPVPDHLVSQLPKGTKAQNECPASEKVNCNICGGWHHPKVRHLSYVGHAAATHLLLDADPYWNWEPLGYTAAGLPMFDESGGLWIRLTVCGVSRIGYGSADKKAHMDAGAREKEVIGDALRNAAIRFGLALELWSKADIHGGNEGEKWFAACLFGIRDAANIGELKARTKAAIEEARARGDQAAEDEFLIAQADKMATAKIPAAQQDTGNKRSNNTPPPPDLADEDVPF
ncbi:hypothetical protein [Roseateles sp. PN1]|uniref:hypothetical protein n=1 Tax=Roseateles sp. PN1 TaxID=3137372 RepID=UPI003139139E